MRLIAVLLVSSAIALGCSGDAASGAHLGSIRGHVVAGPTTPVFRPDDPACADRPVSGALLLLEPLDGQPAETLVSDSDGHFRKSVPPGRYRLVPQPVKGLVGTAAPIEVALLEGVEVDVAFSYDTGIR